MISKVKKFNIFFVEKEEELLKSLQKLGIVEIENLSFEGFENKKISKEKIEEKIRKIEFLKNILIEYSEKPINEKIFIKEDEERKILDSFSIDDLFNYYFSLSQEIERRKKVIERIEKLEEEIIPFIETEIIFYNIFSLSNFNFFIFSLPYNQKIDEINEDLYIEKIGENPKEIFYILLFKKEKKEIAENFLKEIGGEILFVRKWNKKIREIFEKFEKVKNKNEELISELKDKISGILKYKKEIFVVYDYYISFYEFLSVKERLGISKFVKGIKGWIREKDINLLKDTISKILPESYLVFEEPQEGENVPIILENSKLIEPFEVVTDLYGRPIYKNIDPTGPLSIFFAISFGFCL
ncbi:MAG: hypothetical protein NC833_02665, partial [Candidatus Omnitrophica bacterium]|nr:hypothetical protein [Candidatus Omnitrophota bacterium]